MGITRLCRRALFLMLLLTAAAGANAQGTTGTIIGTVTDNTKAVVPGATVTVSGPALMGTRTVVTEGDGSYRVPTLPPGTYSLTFELPGFGAASREGILISVGFTATINVEISPAGVAENVTVSGASPVVDLASTKVSTEFGSERLGALVGSRDYASVTSQLPGITMTRPSVGGTGAITFQRSTRYGMTGHDRGEVEGIVTTEASAGGQEVGYSDSDSFEDMVTNVIGNTAEMPNPGTLTVVVSKSGGNTYRGHLYADYQTENLQAHNIDAAQQVLGVAGSGAVKTEDLNRMVQFRDFSADLGGYIIKDKLWWYGAVRAQRLSLREVVLLDDVHVLSLDVFTAKVAYNLNAGNRFSWYYSRGTKNQNDNILTADTQFVTADATSQQKWPNGPWKVDYNGIFGSNTVLELRTGNFFERGIYDGKGASERYQDTGNNRLIGTANTQRLEHERPQVNGSLTYFKNGWGGSHNFKFGGELMHETDQSLTSSFNNRMLIINNNQPSQVRLFLPPADSYRAIWAFGSYAQDSWKVNSRLTFNLGVRFDQMRSYSPAQQGPTGQQFQRFDAPIWNNVAPRAGIIYALTSDGKTLLKANYGQYWQYPYNDISGILNPNPIQSSSLYTWTPANPTFVNGLPVYVPGQEGRLLSVLGARADGQPSTAVDPGLKNSYSRQALIYFEREVAADFGVRTGFVWNGRRQGYGTINRNTPYSAFNVPTDVPDPGRDGKAGTADDGASIQAFGLDPRYLGLPVDQVLQNLDHLDADYYTWEITSTKRQSGRWSLLASFSETWNYAGAIPFGNSNTLLYTPNALINTSGNGQNVYTTWTAKVSGTIDVPGGVRIAPMFRHQAGTPFARTFNARLNFNSAVAIQAEPVGAERSANINLFDVRAEKNVTLGKVRTGLFFDVYNIFNSNAEQVVTTTSGSAFLRPSVITPPRIARIGLKFNF